MSVCLLIPNGNFTILLEIFLITILISTFIPCEFLIVYGHSKVFCVWLILSCFKTSY